MWRALAAEPSLTAQILEQLLEKVGRDVPYKESRAFLLGGSSERVATPLPMAVSVPGVGARGPCQARVWKAA